MLVHALESAKPGDKILAAQFDQGCDAVLFEVTPEIANLKKRNSVTGLLARRKEETNYLKYLAFNDLIVLEKGMRAEIDKRTALSVLHRKSDMLTGLVGGKCKVCGTAQFPRTRICANPNCGAMDPPNHYGMITFPDGGRLMADITDVEQGQVDAGSRVRMVFRIKDVDVKRGFKRYFWKAVPV